MQANASAVAKTAAAITFATVLVGTPLLEKNHARDVGKGKGRGGDTTTTTTGQITLQGLTTGATVTSFLNVRAVVSPTPSVVRFYLDGSQIAETRLSPYSLGDASGYRLEQTPTGTHTLKAIATLQDGTKLTSSVLSFTVIPDLNTQFSGTLTRYAAHATAQSYSLDTLLKRTQATVTGAKLTAAETSARSSIFAMYLNLGIDPSLDSGNDISTVLEAAMPTGATAKPAGITSWSVRYSADAPYYRKIPSQWPRVQLPDGYFNSIQVSQAYGGDGIGFGVAVASAVDPLLKFESQWYNLAYTLSTFTFRTPSNWKTKMPTNPNGDQHVVFIDPVAMKYISSFKTYAASDGSVRGLYISDPTSFNSMGDRGGSNAAGFADLPVLIQPGEATDPVNQIPHAIGGAVRRIWAARVYPASRMDAGALNGIDTCDQHGPMNTGLVPYGGVIQLDPNLNLSQKTLSLPARRILRAMQVYGYYVMDFGCSDFDIYTSMNASELDPYGGPWGNANGPGVQNEVAAVLKSSKLFVVAPLIKR